jgi:hypothetical protein
MEVTLEKCKIKLCAKLEIYIGLNGHLVWRAYYLSIQYEMQHKNIPGSDDWKGSFDRYSPPLGAMTATIWTSGCDWSK